MSGDIPRAVRSPTHNGLPIKVEDPKLACYRCRGTGVYVETDNDGDPIARYDCAGCAGTGNYRRRAA